MSDWQPIKIDFTALETLLEFASATLDRAPWVVCDLCGLVTGQYTCYLNDDLQGQVACKDCDSDDHTGPTVTTV